MFALVAVKDPETSAGIAIVAPNTRDAEDMVLSLLLAVKTAKPNDQN